MQADKNNLRNTAFSRMSQQKLENVTFFKNMVSPPCRFVHMVLKHLNIECNIKEIDFMGGEHKSPEYEAINPAKAIPALKDGNFCLAESRAIACYICNKYAPDSDLYPKDPEARARVDHVLYADMSFINVMYEYNKIEEVFFENLKPDYSDYSKVHKAFALFENFLSQRKYLAADHVTLADLSAINAVVMLDLVNFSDYSGFPHLVKWMDAMKKLPYYEECTGNPNKELTAMMQAKLNE